jgi:thioesterase domain-containing protein
LAARLHARGDSGQDDAWAVWQHYGRTGSEPAIIGLHGVDDIFVPLARQMLFPVHTLTSRVGFDGSVPPYFPCRSVEDMAERYLAGLRSVQPKGPYTLMGFCLGALITYEVAIRLTEAGEHVAFLGLFNAPPPRAIEASRGERAALHLRKLASLGVRAQARYVLNYVRHNLRILGSSANRSAHGLISRLTGRSSGSVIVGADAPERLVAKIAEFGLQMGARYRHRAYTGHVHLFHGSYWPDDYVDRWSRLAGGGVSAWRMPGGHIDMMEDPHVHEVAAQLTGCLVGAGIEAAFSFHRDEDGKESLKRASA